MPLNPGEFPDKKIHRFCLRCKKWHHPADGRDYIPPRTRHWTVVAARALAGLRDPVRFICHRCNQKRRLVKLLLAATLALAITLLLLHHLTP